ncbi:hypothetical protein [Microbacterium sp. cx-59]|uniref:hypothetical protein n=1 Tax=Microbacterium sp. cx-59 TaxID=2891207 RepID=UPI001E5369EF|nr:hypothetical protein [Microbacterium sp. cx-59]MCC4906789.1 hypothetical protein [Microbacterium sp. cx-59]
MIEKCALAVITNRGRNIIPPSWSELDDDEEDFLVRHVDRVRKTTNASETRGRFRPDSTLEQDFIAAMSADETAFVLIAGRLVQQLASAMQGVNSASCVVALVVEAMQDGGARTVSLLKLDAEVEAAQLDRTGTGVRLRVFRDLLPRPGEIQKALSWPDPRAPHSSLVVLDAIVEGTAKYFQNAFRIDASPNARLTERALVEQLSELPPAKIASAVAAAGNGGDAEKVVERIRRDLTHFPVTAPELGAGGAMPGTIRPQFATLVKKSYEADEIELKLPLARMGQVRTRRVGAGYVTTIRTSTPLTPIDPDDVDGSV